MIVNLADVQAKRSLENMPLNQLLELAQDLANKLSNSTDTVDRLGVLNNLTEVKGCLGRNIVLVPFQAQETMATFGLITLPLTDNVANA